MSLSLQAIKEREKDFCNNKKKGNFAERKKEIEEQAMDITFAAFIHKKIRRGKRFSDQKYKCPNELVKVQNLI